MGNLDPLQVGQLLLHMLVKVSIDGLQVLHEKSELTAQSPGQEEREARERTIYLLEETSTLDVRFGHDDSPRISEKVKTSALRAAHILNKIRMAIFIFLNFSMVSF